METNTIAATTAYNAEKMAKNSLFASPHMFCDLYCLEPGQSQKVHAHDGSDKVYLVIEGTGRFTIGSEEADHGPGTAVMARSGADHGVRNASDARLVLFVTMAPKP